MELNAKERFGHYMHFEKVDRPPFCEYLFFWPETYSRWYKEGLPTTLTGGFTDYFGVCLTIASEHFHFDNINYCNVTGDPFKFVPDLGPIPRFVAKTLEETERYKIWRDENGIIKKELKGRMIFPMFMDHPVKTPEDWEETKRLYDPCEPRRYPANWGNELIEHYGTLDSPVSLGLLGFFNQARNFLGLNSLLTAFYKEPNFIHEIIDFWADFIIEVSKQAVRSLKFDYACIAEDLAYKHGPLISPKLFKEFMLTPYKRLTGFLKNNGIDIILVDSDGNINPLIPMFLEGGVNGLYPMEAAAGVDAEVLRSKYGKRMLMIGNIDKRALVMGREAIEKEVGRKLPLTEDGGYIPSCDHIVPPDVSLENYTYYVSLLKRYLSVD